MENVTPVARSDIAPRFLQWSPIVLGALAATALSSVLLTFAVTIGLPGLVAVNWNGPPEPLQTHSVRMNLRPGSLFRFFVCHSRSCGFLDFWPTTGFLTTASLK